MLFSKEFTFKKKKMLATSILTMIVLHTFTINYIY